MGEGSISLSGQIVPTQSRLSPYHAANPAVRSA
jgi:hypothetical protein